MAVGLAGAACAAGLGACGGSEEPQRTVAQERADRRAPLPPGWRLVVNPRAGFTVGIPPGWTAQGARGATLVRSGDRLLAISIGADRSPDGRNLPPASYARRTATQLPGYRRLRVGRPRALRGARYPGAEVSATGTFARTRVRQAIQVLALRRDRQVTYSLLVFRTASAPASLYRAAIAGMIRTFRARPPQT
ncbi:MAG: hypothetical protein QOJ97_2356 [Solirubrobacteraceae bacterium]|nr:hypothetical protein [Solirubrobacteraceae bacterium]